MKRSIYVGLMVMVVISLAGGIGNIIRYLWGSRPEKLRQNEEYDERLQQTLERYQPIETSETIPPATPPFPKRWFQILCWYGAAIIVLFVIAALIPNPYAYKKMLERNNDYTTLIALEPDNAQWYLSRGVRQGNTEKAMADFDKAIELKPDFALAYFQRAQTRASIADDLHDPDEKKALYLQALADANEGIRLEPKDAKFVALRARQYNRLGDYEATERDYTEAIRMEPTASAYEERANFFVYVKKDLQAALADYTMAIELSKKEYARMGYSDTPHVMMYRSRGEVYKKLGEMEKAAADFERAK